MKRLIALILGIIMLCSLFTACGEKEEGPSDYSQYPFADVAWEREGDHDSESLHFWSDGGFGYSCGCGNPVNDADLCEGYSYDDETKTFTLNYIEETEESVTTVKLIKCDGETLELDFDGDIRVFTKASDNE